ncbi:MAG: 6-phosphogluconolactonase [Alphaproteobacteria bacterium]
MAKDRKPSANEGRGGAPLFAYTGCLTTEKRKGAGEGIRAYRVNAVTGGWKLIQRLDGLVNPSWLLTNRDGTVLYALHADQDYASSFAIDRGTGHLSPLNRASTGGINGVSAKLDPTEKFMILANYGSGHVCVLPVLADGALGDVVQAVALPGAPREIHRVGHQENSRPHDIVFDPTGRFVVVPDKGLDRNFVFRFDARTGRLSPAGEGYIDARSGAGPRHVAFHPNRPIAWVLNELDSTITTHGWDVRSGKLAPLEVISTLPGNFTSDNQASEMSFSTKTSTLYASNRGHDSIAMFRVNRTDGGLRPIGWQASGGKAPRFFAFDPSGRFLYAANLRSHTIRRFDVDMRTGALKPTRQTVKTESPCAIAFV